MQTTVALSITQSIIITTVFVQGDGWVGPNFWGGPWLLEELNAMALALRANFNIAKWDLDLDPHVLDIEDRVVELVAAKIESQEEEARLHLSCLYLDDSSDVHDGKKEILTLVKSKKVPEWKLKHLRMNLHLHWKQMETIFNALGMEDNGHIDRLDITINLQKMRKLEEFRRMERLGKLKKVWEKAEKFLVAFDDYPEPRYQLEMGGGRGENPERDWHQFLDHLST